MTQFTFENFHLHESLNRALTGLGFLEPTEIQRKAIPKLLESERDFVGQAQTGTGKTAAFLLPLIQRLDLKSQSVEGLILTPTRELALQVHQELVKLSKFTKLKSTTVYGGTSYDKQKKALKKDKVQVVVGTPGRVLDLIDKGYLDLSSCQNFVIDEADEMLNMGFLEDVQSLLDFLPLDRKIWMFSATMPQAIKKLVDKNFSNPEFIKTSSKLLTNNDIRQCFVLLDQKDHIKGLRRIVETQPDQQGIIFCETREGCKRVAEKLQDLGVSSLPLHGDLSQSQREYAMGRFKAKKVQLLVCTDVASRGIDVQDLNFVFNLGLPRQDDSYVHRIGRTGRAGAQGMAVSFVDHREKYRIKQLEKKTGVKMEALTLPSIEDLKSSKVLKEIDKLENMVQAIKNMGSEFKVDLTYEIFRNSLKDLSKEEILKIYFSQTFNKDFRLLEEALNIKKVRPAKEGRLRTRGRKKKNNRDSKDKESKRSSRNFGKSRSKVAKNKGTKKGR